MTKTTSTTATTIQPIETPSVSTVQKFSRAMIEQYLRALEVEFLRDSDGDFVVQFGRSPELNVATRFSLAVEGSGEDIFVIRGFADVALPPRWWGRALQFCNDWNRRRRWPKAYLDVDDPIRETTGDIVLEEQIWLPSGIHQALIEAVAETVLLGSSLFWTSFAEAFPVAH